MNVETRVRKKPRVIMEPRVWLEPRVWREPRVKIVLRERLEPWVRLENIVIHETKRRNGT